MRRRLAACIIAISVGGAGAAGAQSSDDVARADALFNAAKALTDAGQFTDACAKFAESKRLAPGIGVTLYLADCYEHIGRTASAWTEFRSAEGLARERNDKRADVARAHAQALEPRLDRLTIVVAPTIPQAGLQVLRDGVVVTAEELGLPSPVDPGDHAVVVSSPGHATQTFTAHVGPEAPNATIRIDALDAPASPGPVPEPTPTSIPQPPPPATTLPVIPESPPPADRGVTRRYIGIGVGALGVAGIVVGSVFGVVVKQKFDQTNVSECNATDHCTTPGLAGRKDAEHAATASDVGFTIGAVLVAGGVVLYLTAPKPSATGVVLAPAPMVGGGGALLRANF
jgi:hypothetical protein